MVYTKLWCWADVFLCMLLLIMDEISEETFSKSFIKDFSLDISSKRTPFSTKLFEKRIRNTDSSYAFLLLVLHHSVLKPVVDFFYIPSVHSSTAACTIWGFNSFRFFLPAMPQVRAKRGKAFSVSILGLHFPSAEKLLWFRVPTNVNMQKCV